MSGCADTCCFIPPLLNPGPTSDCMWCITSCGTCGRMHRRYATKDYVEITPLVRKTFIRMLSSAQLPMQVDPARMHIYMEIRLRGCDTMIACYDAFQRTLDGYLGFYWDQQFLSANPGLYVGDVFVECNYCFSVRFRISRCSIVVDSFYNEMATEDCGQGECSMIVTVGEGVVGGTECPSPDPSECGLPAPYFETMDPVVEDPPNNCQLGCSPPFTVSGDDIIGSI